VNRSRLWAAFKYVLGISIIVWLFWANWHKIDPHGNDVGIATALERPINFGALVLAAIICALSVLLTFVRWFVLVRAQGLPFTVTNALRLGMIGYYLSQFLPGSVSGDLFKAAFLAREQSRRTVAVATVLIDRALGLCALFWLVTLTGAFFWGTGLVATLTANDTGYAVLESIFRGATILCGGTLAFWLILGFLPQRRADIFAGRLRKIPKLGGPLAEFWGAVWMYRCRSRAILLALGMAIIGHIGFVFTFYFCALALSSPDQIPPLQTHFLLVPVAMTIQAGMPTPGGMGGGEWAYGELYNLLGFSMASGLLGSIVQRVVIWIISFTGYLVYLRMRPSLQAVRLETQPPLTEPQQSLEPTSLAV
jgi:glycosyltransferase 2 family protein